MPAIRRRRRHLASFWRFGALFQGLDRAEKAAESNLVALIIGRIGTIRRTDGSQQLTYNGHPLYTYIGDSTPGQARGNNLNLNGGLWHEVPVSRP